MALVAAEVVPFMGVFLQIEQLVTVEVWIMDQLVARVPHHPLLVAKVSINFGVNGILFPCDDRLQAFPLNALGDRYSREVANRGIKVPQVARFACLRIPLDPQSPRAREWCAHTCSACP